MQFEGTSYRRADNWLGNVPQYTGLHYENPLIKRVPHDIRHG
jgi:hypothetical protein